MQISSEMITDTLSLFVSLGVQLTLLFLGISFFVGLLQYYIPPKKVRNILSSKNGKGYIIAGFLGAITPFCSCSTIPFLKGLLRAQAGFGPTLVFLFSSPLLNPIVMGLLVVTFGLHVAIFYFVVAMGVSIIAGYCLEKMGFEQYVKTESNTCQDNNNGCSQESPQDFSKINSHVPWKKIWITTWADFIAVLPYLVISVFVGSIIYGFAPTDFISKITSHYPLLAVPIAALIGIPLYIRASMMIPISAALAAKGLDMGVILAFIIGSAGASLTEVILLQTLFKKELIAMFLFIVLTMAVTAGYSYQYFEIHFS